MQNSEFVKTVFSKLEDNNTCVKKFSFNILKKLLVLFTLVPLAPNIDLISS